MAALAGRITGRRVIPWEIKKALLVFSTQFQPQCFRAEIPDPLATSSQHPSQGKNEKWRWSGLLLFIPGAATFGLGTWQLFRRQQKIELIEHRQKRLEQDPVPLTNFLSDALNSQSDTNINSLEFRKVVCEGVYDESKSIYVGPRSRSVSGITENGYFLITPLIPVQKNNESVQLPVLVNRGWVPRSRRDESFQNPKEVMPVSNTTSSENDKAEGGSWWKFWVKTPVSVKDTESNQQVVKVIGVIRGSENPSIFVPQNDPDSGQWFYVDVPAIARAVGLSENTFYVEEIDGTTNASNPYPVRKDANAFVHYSVMPQDHLNYALTWYTLSAATIFMAKKRLQKKSFRK